MSHYNFKKITVVPGGKVISLFSSVDMNICCTVCKVAVTRFLVFDTCAVASKLFN